ncbi:MAG: thioredoxin-disulfide reductase [Endomicrobium sp.]|jgi:thioredoxin reductase (NADPH)|nr:thioredoxin-disulfide reductase [Endomicrobium sp.]
MYDVVIIGGGPSGLTAAIYASRAGLNALIIEKAGCGGQMAITDALENYPGFSSVNGFELASKLEEQARNFGAAIIYEEVVEISDGAVKKVKTVGAQYETKTIIIASGTNAKKLGAAGEENFIGRGVSFCAVCDAPFYKNKTVAVVGGGDSAIQEAIYLSKFASSVFVLHRRDKLRAAKSLQNKMLSHQNISVIYDVAPEEICGKEKIEKFIISNVKTGEKTDLKVDGIFVFIGLTPNSAFLQYVALDENGYIIADENMKTNIAGIFACGDVRKKHLRQVVTAASDGAQAAVSALDYIEKQGDSLVK